MNDGFLRVAAATVPVAVADTRANVAYIVESARALASRGVRVAVMPELCITGYTCGELFHNARLLEMAEKGVREVAEASREFPSMLLVIGAPLRCGDRLLNCAVAIADGRVL